MPKTTQTREEYRLSLQGISQEELTRQYWQMSRIAYDRAPGLLTVGELLGRLADIAGSANNHRWVRLEEKSATVLQKVIDGGRKKKGPYKNNLIILDEYSSLPEILFAPREQVS